MLIEGYNRHKWGFVKLRQTRTSRNKTGNSSISWGKIQQEEVLVYDEIIKIQAVESCSFLEIILLNDSISALWWSLSWRYFQNFMFNFLQVCIKLINVSLASNPSSDLVPKLIFLLITYGLISNSAGLLCNDNLGCSNTVNNPSFFFCVLSTTLSNAQIPLLN